MKRLVAIVALLTLFAPWSAWAQWSAATNTQTTNTQQTNAGWLVVPYTQSSCGSTCTIDFTKSTFNYVQSVTAATTLSFVAPYAQVHDLRLEICQDTTGGRTVTWPTNVKDGGTTPGIDAIFPLQVSACGTVTMSYDGGTYHITGKPSLQANCNGQTLMAASTATISNKCCNVATNVFVCSDITAAAACQVSCSAGSISLKSANATDTLNWGRIY